ncbi:uncharacterized protein LOC106780159 [Vigna radiata var. radiata]|uniref:Uncharacterized protein LOC106780159 n=1 Tax=Vigna radiata var. radiata TaxID=3916 RepID=A0A1S3VZW7_VIGRR|nr:uncharacterized protein LOC106780159 [Vigna radiata var. radiata]
MLIPTTSLLHLHFSLSLPKAMMNKFKKSQVLVLCVLLVLLVITPYLPSSLRPTYLYFIINFLIMSLCAEAGLLSVFPRPLEDKKQPVSVMASEASSEKRVSEDDEKSGESEGRKVEMMQKGSLLLIEGEDEEVMMDEEDEAEEEIGGVNGQELFAKAEAFIGNFYKQLKMQSEESWIYQKGF